MASRKYHIGPSRIHGNGLIASRNLLPEDIIGPTHQNDKNHENIISELESGDKNSNKEIAEAMKSERYGSQNDA